MNCKKCGVPIYTGRSVIKHCKKCALENDKEYRLKYYKEYWAKQKRLRHEKKKELKNDC